MQPARCNKKINIMNRSNASDLVRNLYDGQINFPVTVTGHWLNLSQVTVLNFDRHLIKILIQTGDIEVLRGVSNEHVLPKLQMSLNSYC